MLVTKRIHGQGGIIALDVQASFDEIEMQLIQRFGLLKYRIKTKDGAFVGRDALSMNLKAAYRAQLGKIKNRWSTALIRTTGFVVVDSILLILGLAYLFLRGLVRIVFGRRKRLSTAIHGITVKSRRIETIKEAEFFIFVSLAAVEKAIEYLKTLDQESVYRGSECVTFMEGLDFAGAGTQVESEFEAASMLIEHLPKGA
jgi:hypothetical protein